MVLKIQLNKTWIDLGAPWNVNYSRDDGQWTKLKIIQLKKVGIFVHTLSFAAPPPVWWKNWKIIRLTDHDTQILTSYVK